jgi:uncharacterized FAD-dependent dehydrogenase
MIRLNSVHLPFDHSETELELTIIKLLGIPREEMISYRIYKRSLDARKGRPLLRVYSLLVEVKTPDALAGIIRKSDKISLFRDQMYEVPRVVPQQDRKRPLVIGSGPAGLFAGLVLAEAGLNPLILERGSSVQERTKDVRKFWEHGILDPESNVQFGEGGAGTFSDGKLRTRVKDKSQRTQKILEELTAAGAPEEILYDHKPHVGTANLVKVVKNLRLKIEQLGGEYRFNAKVVDLILENEKLVGVLLADGQQLFSDIAILAIGHSARDTFEMLQARGVKFAPKAFSAGFRIEHPQAEIDRNQYGKFAGHPDLGAAEYQLSYRTSSGRSVYSFCMCPGGSVIGASSEENGVVTNGMSQYTRAESNANSAIVAEVYPVDYGQQAMDGFHFQRHWEQNAFRMGGANYDAPVQLVGDFLRGEVTSTLGEVTPSYRPGYQFCDLRTALPEVVVNAILEALPMFNQKIPGFTLPGAVLTGVETRTSSPLRILRGEDLESISIRGLYPVGEGSGYAGGIMSSAIDGIKAAEKIIEHLNQSASITS